MSDGRKYYCFCEANCKFETMTKEQTLAAIAQAAETGLVFDADAAFITKVKEGNAGNNLTFWMGTQAQYNALVLKGEKDPKCFYILTDCDAPAELTQKVKDLQNRLDSLTAADVGAAPAGFGLGEKLPADIDHFDLANRTGWFRSNQEVVSFGLTPGWWFGNYIPYGDNEGVWELNHYLDGLKANIRKVNGVLQPAEWVNPPMELGAEYRTTERYGGKPVYTMAVDIGYGCSAGSVKDVGHGISNLQYIVSCQAFSDYPAASPSAGFIPTDLTIVSAIAGLLRVSSTVDTTATHFYAILKYTKTTD